MEYELSTDYKSCDARVDYCDEMQEGETTKCEIC